jgi:hypothetical protein
VDDDTDDENNHQSPSSLGSGNQHQARVLPEQFTHIYHPVISGRPCDKQGNDIPQDAPPPPPEAEPDTNDWTPYESRAGFELADFLYTSEQMSGGHIDKLLGIWAATLVADGAKPPFKSHKDLYSTIDSTPHADCPWETLKLQYDGTKPERDIPPWMTSQYDVWYRDPCMLVKNILSNPGFNNEFDCAPLQEHDTDGNHRFQNFMSGNWCWKQADIIAEDPITHGSMFVPIILGSDKTTVSVATGNNEYWPVYLSIGNIHNNVRRAHRDGLVLLGFLAVPKTNKKYSDDVDFRKFRRQLYHSSLAKILEPLKSGMTTPETIPNKPFWPVSYKVGVRNARHQPKILTVVMRHAVVENTRIF